MTHCGTSFSRHPLPGRLKSGSKRRSHHSTVSCCLQTIRSSICTSAAKADIDPKRGVGHIVVMGERDLGHQLTNRATYHSAARTHLALDKDAPLRRPAQKLGRIMSVPWLGGLHQQYVWMA